MKKNKYFLMFFILILGVFSCVNQKRIIKIRECNCIKLTEHQLNEWNFIDSVNCHIYRKAIGSEIFNNSQDYVGYDKRCIIEKLGIPDKIGKGWFRYILHCSNEKEVMILVFKYKDDVIYQVLLRMS